LERHYRTIPKQASLFAFLGICDPKDITKAEALYEKYITSMDSDLPGQSLRLQIALLQAIQTIPGFKNFQVPTKEELELFWRKVFADIPIFKTPRIEELIKDSMFPNFSPKDWVTFVIGNFDRIVALDSILWQKTKRT
jgi:hypothetical protein